MALIYAVEDDKNILEIEMFALKNSGYQVEGFESAREFYKKHGITCEFHYIDISDSLWKKRIDKRNRMVENGEISAYYVDEGLAEKAEGFFEKPSADEIDVWVTQSE